MATFLYFDANTQYGAKLRAMLNINESADDQLADVRDMLIQMREGADGSSDDHYIPHVKFLGYGGYTPTQGDPTTAQKQIARSSFEELDSAYSKTSGNGSVSNVRAARDQVYAKHRG